MDKEDVAEVAVDALGDVVFVEVAKVAPSVTVTGFTFFGHPLSEWAQLLAIIYSSLMIFFLLRDPFDFYRQGSPFWVRYTGSTPPPFNTTRFFLLF